MPQREPLTVTQIRQDRIAVPNVVAEIAPPRGKKKVVRLSLTPIVLGSGADGDVQVDDDSVSRRHCDLALTVQGVRARDLGSKNGTVVAGVRIFDAILPPDAEMHLGKTRVKLRAEGSAEQLPLSPDIRFGEALGASMAMRVLFAKLASVAPTDETVVLLGESGTGKELLSRAIHDGSTRRGAPFLVFDCSAVAPTLIESELFGHAKGAFTGAVAARQGLLREAHGGTLFIDEIGELPLDLQPKLLRALEARTFRPVGGKDWETFDARIIAATHRDLRMRVSEGTFREDLYYRLAVVEVVIPPLRERREDIALLVDSFLAQHGRTRDDLPPNALEMLQAHDWPGNIRELRNTVTRMVLFPQHSEDAIRPPISTSSTLPPARRMTDSYVHLPLRDARALAVEQFERDYIKAKLHEQGGNVTRAAQSMGVSRQLLHRLLERYGMRSGVE